MYFQTVAQLCETDLEAKAAKAVLCGSDDYKQKDTARSKLSSVIIKNELKNDENHR